ncbi:hypothetical protein B0H11DRAFT_928307 [Mycena galericulata]|nr:hypothetical protein B0H11DRAFT_928307 [Mycena galericulata]
MHRWPAGTWRFLPRYLSSSVPGSGVFEWDRDEDDELPAPWVWYGSWNDFDMLQLQERYHLPELTPVIFRCTPDMPVGEVAVFSSEDGTFYVQDHEPDLWQFEGTFTDDEDFVENADWNRLDPVAEFYYWEDPEYKKVTGDGDVTVPRPVGAFHNSAVRRRRLGGLLHHRQKRRGLGKSRIYHKNSNSAHVFRRTRISFKF